MLHAVIMAGGAGTRFWPASRVNKPKQLLDLTGNRTMIQATVDRLKGLIPSENVHILTNVRLVEAIQTQLPEVPPASILGEPCKRDTAPCIGLAASLVLAADDDATMIVTPADHVIGTDQQFQDAMQYAADLVEADPNRIVTFGIRPTYPASTFGYIERAGESAFADGAIDTYRVQKFREKPDIETAKEYLESGQFYWNSGIFVWKAKTILNALKEFEPGMYQHLQLISESIGKDNFPDVLTKEFAAIVGKSIDYAVMERYDNALVIEAPFEWDDVGNWPSLARLKGTDKQGNTVVGKHLGIETHNSIIRGDDDHLLVTVGLDECIVIRTPDATLVASRESEESIRKVVEMLSDKGWTEYL